MAEYKIPENNLRSIHVSLCTCKHLLDNLHDYSTREIAYHLAQIETDIAYVAAQLKSSEAKTHVFR